jgi:hypothetical protein
MSTDEQRKQQRQQQRRQAFDGVPLLYGVTQHPDGNVTFRTRREGESEEEYQIKKDISLQRAREEAQRKRKRERDEVTGDYRVPLSATVIQSAEAQASHRHWHHIKQQLRVDEATGKKTNNNRFRAKRREKRAAEKEQKEAAAAAAAAEEKQRQEAAAAAERQREEAAAAAAVAEKRRQEAAAAAAVPFNVRHSEHLAQLMFQHTKQQQKRHRSRSPRLPAAAVPMSSTAAASASSATAAPAREAVVEEEDWESSVGVAPYYAPPPAQKRGDIKKRFKAQLKQQKQQQQRPQQFPSTSSAPQPSRVTASAAAAARATPSGREVVRDHTPANVNIPAKQKLLRNILNQHFYWAGAKPREVRTANEILNCSNTAACRELSEFCDDNSDLFYVRFNHLTPHLSEIYQHQKPRFPPCIDLQHEWVLHRDWAGVVRKLKREKELGFDAEFHSANDADQGIKVVSLFSPSEQFTYVFHTTSRDDLTPKSLLGQLVEDDGIVKYHVGPNDIDYLLMHNLRPRSFIDVQVLATAVIKDVLPSVTSTQFASNTLANACGMRPPYYWDFKYFVNYRQWRFYGGVRGESPPLSAGGW